MTSATVGYIRWRVQVQLTTYRRVADVRCTRLPTAARTTAVTASHVINRSVAFTSIY